MTTPDLLTDKRMLECLRLEAECKQLAEDVHQPSLQLHFMRMAKIWKELACAGYYPDIARVA